MQKPKPTAFAVTLNDISFTADAGEILAIAGVAGNGQDEIMAALSGEWRPPSAGVIMLDGQDISHLGPAARRRVGLGVVLPIRAKLPIHLCFCGSLTKK